MGYTLALKRPIFFRSNVLSKRSNVLRRLNLGCSFISLIEPCNNQRPRCDIAWLHVTYHLYHGFPS
jgi:hypothetical protein